MTHLYIELNTGLTEEVNSSIIAKLYELASSGDLDNTSDLKGRLHSTVARDVHVAYLNANYSDLHVSADKLYITFEDAEVDRILTLKYGDGLGVTEMDMLSVTGITTSTGFADNTTILTFNELGRFSTIKSLYTFAFNNCTSLTSIDLSNIEHVGGLAFTFTNLTGVINLPNVISIGDSSRARSFCGCTNITEVNIGPNFNADTTYMGYVFDGCTNLEKVTGLNDVTLIPECMFHNCSNLTSVDFDFSKITNFGHGCFWACKQTMLLPTTITTPATSFGVSCLEKNKTILKVVLTGSDIDVYNWVFYDCLNLTEIVNSNRIRKIGVGVFYNCGLTTLDLSGVTGMVTGRILNNDQGGTDSIISNMPNLLTVTIGHIPTLSSNDYSTSRTSIHNCPNLTTIDIALVDTMKVSHNPFIYNCPLLQKFILRCTTVPTLTLTNASQISTIDMGALFHNATPYIYVPDAALNDYKTAPNWSNVATYIKGISELPS